MSQRGMVLAEKSVFWKSDLIVGPVLFVGILQVFLDKTVTLREADAMVSYPGQLVLLTLRILFQVFSLLTDTQ